MNRKAWSRVSAVLTVTALLSTTAWAGEWTRPEPAHGLFATVWQLLSSLVAGSNETADGRATLDPNGGPAPTQSGTDDDGRASMDPNG